MEKWKPIYGNYDYIYEVSNLGRVRNSFTDKILKSNLNNRLGYVTVTLRRNKNKHRISLSNLVANAFIPNPNNDLYVGYKDGDRENIVSSNLYWYSSTLKEVDKGKVFGKFTVLKDLGIVNNNHMLKVRCSCGNISEEIYTVINTGRKEHCGCVLPDIIPLNIEEVNKKDLGDWTVVEELFFQRRKNGGIQRKVLMRCKCGYEKRTDYSQIKVSNSCTNCATEKIRSKMTNEERRDRQLLYGRWGGMKQRCYDPNDKSYSAYGAKGITICDEWLEKPKRFVEWALGNGFERHLELDRKENDKGYSPDNCQFITKEENALKNSLINLTPEDVHWIRSDEYNLITALKKFNCSEETITNIREGKTFTSI